MIEEKDPMVYDSIKQKVKYFTPAFHSMTPEGLNARLTFLNQCVRPGETIPVIGTDGKPKYNDALNTSFGAPPVLVLRIGDFYHTKVIPDTISFNYEPLVYDMNPEGIGIQPMFVNVSMGVKFIGAHGLAKPIEQLQNALSFNYYANTEIYDERATPTEDTSKLDKEILNSIVAKEAASITPAVPQIQKQNEGGTTIGEIITNIPVTSGQTGETSFQKIMDTLVDTTKTYMENTFNTMEKMVSQTNFAIMQLVSQERNYYDGKIDAIDSPMYLYGKPKNEANRINVLFEKAVSNINDGSNPILKELFGNNNNNGFTPLDVQKVKNNMVGYVNGLKDVLLTTIATITQELTISEQDYVQVIRKCNLVYNKTDGKILESGEPRIYDLTQTDMVSEPRNTTNTYDELKNDYSLVPLCISEYNDKILLKIEVNSEGGSSFYNEDGDFVMANDKNFEGLENKIFFTIISRIFYDDNKKEDFKTKITNESPDKLKRKFSKIVNDLAKDYSSEIDDEEKKFKKLRNSKEYKDLTDGITDKLYVKGKTRKFNYTTVPNPQTYDNQKQSVINLYKTDNVDPNTPLTWVDKKIFL